MEQICKWYGLFILAAALVALALNITVDLAMAAVLALVFGRI